METLLIVAVVALVGVFTTDKVVEVQKHEATIQADKYNSCMTATKDARQCRGLE